MILLDTNILSELMRPAPEGAVEQWLADQPEASVFISAITEAELRYGAKIMPPGKRQAALVTQIEGVIEEDFSGRILPFDSSAAVAFAEIASLRRQAGRPISQADAQIAAIARSRGAALATRNVPDFEGCGVKIINPWAAARE
jgi:predicted nucleic acid-binding protein